ncbi:hypothetical protein [Streptomyces sp. NPDC001502]|uniref:hypothetical protein n=1 Tax=Streptomyces sp. NPDC001502 TaxID=3364578 RepID=UPI003682EB08
MNDTLLLAAGWLQTGGGIGGDIKDLIFDIAIPCLCGAFVVFIGWKTKAPGPTIMAVIFASIVWGGAANMEGVLKDKTVQDIKKYDTPPAPKGDK